MKAGWLLAAATMLAADTFACETKLPVDGTLGVTSCVIGQDGCVAATQALNEYLAARKKSPDVLTVAVQGSPWHFFGPDHRIVTVDALAVSIRQARKPEHQRVTLYSSWSGVAPDRRTKSLAKRMAKAVDLPVEGMDGFLWVGPGGQMRTTRQARTAHEATSPYGVQPNGEVFTPLVSGWATGPELELDDAYLLLVAAEGQEVFLLCPDAALAGFEKAAEKGSAIAAYNAGVVHLERGDRKAARRSFERGAELGDDSSKQQLAALKEKRK